jgi:hypothetical protein
MLFVGISEQMQSLADAETASTQTSLSNAAIFLKISQSFSKAIIQIVQGQFLGNSFNLGTLLFHVDATTKYQVKVFTQFDGTTTQAPHSATFSDAKTASTACQVSLDSSEFADGNPGKELGWYSPTIGTPGRDHRVDLRVQGTQYRNAPVGSYTCAIKIRLEDGQGTGLEVIDSVVFELQSR